MSWATRGAWVALLGLLLSACGDSGEDVASAGPAPFERIPWVVTSGLDAPGAAEHAPSATFEDGKVSGRAGCNSYGGRFASSGETLEISEIGTTLMGCAEPAQTIEWEFLEKLRQVRRWRLEGDELVLEDDDGQELLRLGEASLIGNWEATGFRQRDAVASLLPGTEITARFGSDRTLTGSAGCNRYSAGYTTHGNSIEIEPAALTRKACASPEGVMEQENDYVAALTQATSYTVEGRMLTLLAAEGTTVATYQAAR